MESWKFMSYMWDTSIFICNVEHKQIYSVKKKASASYKHSIGFSFKYYLIGEYLKTVFCF